MNYEEFDVFDLVKDAIDAASPLAQQRQIRLLNGTAAIKAIADRRRLMQVLTNYLSNAIKFSGNNTTVTISSELSGPDKMRLMVQDQGAGLDEETRMLVFDRYYQAEGELKKQGYGLGLAISKLIVEAHQGRVGVDSSPGNGCNFWFEIPIKGRSNPTSNMVRQDLELEQSFRVAQRDNLMLGALFIALVLILRIEIKAKIPSTRGSTSNPEEASYYSMLSARSGITIPHQFPSLSRAIRNLPPEKGKRAVLLKQTNKFISGSNDPAFLLLCYMIKGNIERAEGDIVDSIDSFRRAAEYSSKDGKTDAITARCYSVIANLYVQKFNAASKADRNDILRSKEFAGLAIKILASDRALTCKYNRLPGDLQPTLPSISASKAFAYQALASASMLENNNSEATIAYLENAIDACTKAREQKEIEPLRLVCPLLLSDLLWKNGRKKEAKLKIEELRKEVEQSSGQTPGSAAIWQALGWSYLQRREFEKAQHCFQRGLEDEKQWGIIPSAHNSLLRGLELARSKKSKM